MIKLTIAISVFILMVASTISCLAQIKLYNLKNGVAIRGYDPVAYFDGNPVKGSSKISSVTNGITYYFNSTENKEKFDRQPSKYQPQYGGWCAYAMGEDGSKVEINPETFKILNGKLYLFYNKLFNNTLESWNKDEANLKSQADDHWQMLLSR